MLDLAELKKDAEHLMWLKAKGEEALSSKLVVAALIHPLLDLLAAMESSQGERWYTLTEAIRKSGRNRNYFEKPLRRLDGRCRLEQWREDGLADQADGGLWLISPLMVAEAGGSAGCDPQPASRVADSTPVDVASAVERFTQRKSA